MREGDVFIIGDVEFHRIEAAHEKSITNICLYFKPEFIYNVGQNSCDVEYLKPFYSHSAEFQNRITAGEIDSNAIFEIMKKIFREIAEKEDFYQLAVKSYLTEILLHIIRYYRRFKTDLIAFSSDSPCARLKTIG